MHDRETKTLLLKEKKRMQHPNLASSPGNQDKLIKHG